MAEAPKKTKTKKVQTTAEPVVEKKLPEVKQGENTVILSDDELYSLVQVLGISRDLFKQMAISVAIEGDHQAEEIYTARSQLSATLFNKIRTVASIGEPTSRAFH